MSSGPGGRGYDEPGDDADGAGSGGWIPPGERAWRHPSELGAVTRRLDPPRGGWLHRHRAGASIAVGTTAAAAVIVGLFLLLSASAVPQGTTALDNMPIGTAATTQCCRLAASLARNDEAALVSLHAPGGASACAVAVGDGQLIATTRAALHGARRLPALAADGERLTATLVATDPGSGIALLRLSKPLPPAPVDQVPALSAGSPAMAVALAVPANGRGAPRAVWTSGTVVSMGTPDPTGHAQVSAITVRGPSVPTMAGQLLVDGRGGVVGLMDGSSGNVRTFLPIRLVVGVASDLDTMGKVHHGWLDVAETTATGSAGAQVVSVAADGASAHLLRPGDVIVALDGSAVVSAPQLRTLLYTMAPGTRVTVDALRGNRLVTVVVELSPSP